ncbi:restriction endonuclease subunit S [Bifidobacterium bifidum]|uniref:restriction endonuclease subunit S n=2 Tax=Bifidobacterium bifidum TaxID=1681 RepID=UPI0034A43D76
MNEIQNTPELRFEGFTEPWEQRKLGELSSEFQSGDFISAEKILASGPYPVYGGNGLRGYAKRYNHDGFYALIGRQGALCGNVNTAVGKAYFTEHAVAIKANSLHDTRFLVHLLRCMDLGQYSGQSAQPGLAVGVLKEVETTVPSKVEQQAIGSFFSRLDDLITLQQRKYERLQHLKQAMLRKMFPKPDEQVPELRFEGFTEPWEQRKVSDIATLRRGLTYSPSDVVSPGQGVRVLRSSNIVEDRFVLRDDDVFVREEAVNIPFSRDGEILITAANGSTRLVGKRAKISGLTGKTVHGGFMLIAATEQPDFLCALMGTEWYRNFLRVGVAGGNGAIGNLDSHALECEKVSIPSNAEQRAIGDFFSNLDYFITLQQRKYERLQHLKQAMLQRMFV